jgi:hypothetical protein
MRQSYGMNSVVRMNRNSGFPHHFAICRSIRPVQFQLLTIVPDMDYIHERDHYHIENSQLDNLDPMYIDLQSMHNGETSTGDFYVSIPGYPQEQGRRVRYEIQPIFLRNNLYVIPIVLLDSLVGIPRPEMLILPYNAERQAESPIEDPHRIMNYLRNPNNFAQPRRLDQERARLSVHRDYDDHMNRYIQTPIMYPRDYEMYFQGDVHFHDRARTPPRHFARPREHFNHRGAGAGAVHVEEVPRLPPAQEPVAVRRPMALQAFTIQALISHAIKENMTCPISMNAIEQGTACVTSCQHIFERSAIQRWFQDNTSCPVCRQEASVCT